MEEYKTTKEQIEEEIYYAFLEAHDYLRGVPKGSDIQEVVNFDKMKKTEDDERTGLHIFCYDGSDFKITVEKIR